MQRIKYDVIFDKLIGFIFYLAGVLIIGIMLIVSAGVITRYFLNFSIKMSVEFSEYMLFGIIFLSMAWIQRNQKHIKIDVVSSRLSSKNQVLLNFTTSAIMAIFCLVMLWASAGEAWSAFQRHTIFYSALIIPKAPILAIMPVTFFLTAIQLMRDTRNYWVSWRKTVLDANKELLGES